jgi:hypothetical protein
MISCLKPYAIGSEGQRRVQYSMALYHDEVVALLRGVVGVSRQSPPAASGPIWRMGTILVAPLKQRAVSPTDPGTR